MDRKTIGSYGGPKTDAQPVQNPETQIASSEYNRIIEDVAQLTRPCHRAVVRFATTAAAPPVTYAAGAVTHHSMWGSGDAQKPTVQKTATGRYTITYATTFTDPLGVVESVAFFAADYSVMTGDPTDTLAVVPLTVTSNVVTLAVYAGGVLADIGDVSGVAITVMAWLL